MKWPMVSALVILAGCGSSPPPRTYVLSAPADPVARVSAEAGRPVLEVQRVTLPDFLDTKDMVSRDGRNEVKVSDTGHWGERLSEGITDALTAGLDRRLPRFLVAHTADSGTPSRRLLVAIDAFDVRPDGTCVLSARWTVQGDDRKVLIARHDTIITHTSRSGSVIADASVAEVMSAAVSELAGRIAASPALAAPRR